MSVDSNVDFNLPVIYIKVAKYWYYGDNANDNWKPLKECITPPTNQVSWIIDQIHRVPYKRRDKHAHVAWKLLNDHINTYAQRTYYLLCLTII